MVGRVRLAVFAEGFGEGKKPEWLNPKQNVVPCGKGLARWLRWAALGYEGVWAT